MHFHRIYYRIYNLEKMQLLVNSVRMTAAQYAENQGPKTRKFDSCLKILACLCTVTSVWQHRTTGTAAALFKGSTLCCLSLAYTGTKAATRFDQTGLLDYTQHILYPELGKNI